MAHGNDWTKTKREEILASRGNRCALCSATELLEMAHKHATGISGRGRGRVERVRDWLKNPDAYVLLCRDCHLWFDRKQSSSSRPT